ncbi:TetR/AcrR family transcriptional regulator [Streptomyces hainanensis]|uniref:TetR/AcrR family transcriptional regulator n=1 Tax=Streptomyces hainanensis TaxID=402648 RepID=A0A4R4TH94_9ACTN|nr:TetR/AcrR family transcriptional regulator [Streptomyces hainanensis]TDC74323.1 TetR/AcrR family transcriptional regulator [Streptomyces hainanensis]
MTVRAETSRRYSRLTPERERALLEATLQIIREKGYEGLTLEQVAARTRSSKATLYRQWGDKPTLVASALRASGPMAAAYADTGSLAGDLRHWLTHFADRESDLQVLVGLYRTALTDAEALAVLREVVIDRDFAPVRQAVAAAVGRGEIPADGPAVPYLTHMLIGCLLAGPLVDADAWDLDAITRYLDRVILPVLALR